MSAKSAEDRERSENGAESAENATPNRRELTAEADSPSHRGAAGCRVISRSGVHAENL